MFFSDQIFHFRLFFQIDLKHDGDSNTLRENGRKFNENREIICELGIMNNPSVSGSALFQIGNTKVAAFLSGPHQVSLQTRIKIQKYFFQFIDNTKRRHIKPIILWRTKGHFKCQIFRY